MLNSEFLSVYAYNILECGEDEDIEFNFKSKLRRNGYNLLDQQVFFEYILEVIPLNKRTIFFNIINGLMDKNDILVIWDFDSLGGNFNEIYSSLETIWGKDIRLVCLKYSSEVTSKKEVEFFFSIYKSFNGVRNKYKKKNSKRYDEQKFFLKKEDIFVDFENGTSICSLTKDYLLSKKEVLEIIKNNW